MSDSTLLLVATITNVVTIAACVLIIRANNLMAQVAKRLEQTIRDDAVRRRQAAPPSSGHVH